MNMGSRDYSVDFVKGWLIFLVVFGHVLANFLQTNYEHNSLYILIYSFHMPVFFMISGFFARKTVNLEFGECIRHKFRRLIIPAFIWTLFAFLFYYFFYMRCESLSRIIVSAIRSIWFLWALFLFFLMASLIWKFKYKYYIAIVLSIVLWFTHRWQNPYIFDYLHITREWPCFLLGLLYSEFLHTGKSLSREKLLITWVVSLIIYVLTFYCYTHSSSCYEIRCIMLLTGGMVHLPVIKIGYKYILRIPKIANCIVALGGASMGIYLVDSIGKKIISYSFGFISNCKTDNILILFLVAVLFTCICYAITMLIRKSTVLKKYLLGE